MKNGGHLLAYDMGLGKTLTSLAAAEDIRARYSVVIGCPAIAVGVWEAELEKWFPGRRVVALTSSNIDIVTKLVWDYIIVSLDLVARNAAVAKAVRSLDFAVLILDEAHNLKSMDAQRTDVWLTGRNPISDLADWVWLLTGTPTPNHAGELYPMIRATAPKRIDGMTAEQFEERYCKHKMVTRNGYDIRVVSGTNLVRVKELRKRLDGWWLRLKTSDVFKDMPALLTRVVPIDVGTLPKELKSLETSKEGALLRAAISSGDIRSYSLDDDDSMSRYRKLLAQVKAKKAAEYTAYVVDGGVRGVILWFWHLDGMDIAENELKRLKIGTARIDGSTPKSKRDAAVKSFQSATGPIVMIAQIKAAGVAITLTKATHQVFAEASWNPADNVQAMKRAHRIGQDHPVQVDFLAVKDSLDMALLTVVERKQAQSDALEG